MDVEWIMELIIVMLTFSLGYALGRKDERGERDE